MVLHPVSETETPPTHPLPPPPPPPRPPRPPMVSSAFFVKPPSPYLHNFPYTNYRYSMNHPSFHTNRPVHYGMNPFLHYGSPSNRVENNNNSFWSGTSNWVESNNSSRSRVSGLNPLQPYGPQPNQTNNNNSSSSSYGLRDSDLNLVHRFGLQPNPTVNNNPTFRTNNNNQTRLNSPFHIGSSPNRTENTNSFGLGYSNLRLGSPVNHAENNNNRNSSRMRDTSLNQVLRFGSLPNQSENNNNSSGLVDLNQSKNNHANGSGDSSLNPVPHFDLQSNQVEKNKNKNKNDSPSLGDSRIDKSESDDGARKGIEKQGELDDTPEKKESKNKDCGDASDDGVSEEGEDEEGDAEYSFEDLEPNFPFVKTWNLRPRKPLIKKPLNSHNTNGEGGSRSGGLLASRTTRSRMVRTQACETAPMEMQMEMEKDKVATQIEVRYKWPMISMSLMKEEIEEDFIRMTGDKPPKKPKKRARNVQKQLDVRFPGLRLNGVTPDIYRVRKSHRKR